MQRFVNDKGSVLASWSSSCSYVPATSTHTHRTAHWLKYDTRADKNKEVVL